MITLLLQAIVLVAASVIVVRAEPALNRMSKTTPLLVRLSFHLLTLGAIAEIVFVLAGGIPAWQSAITTAGIAALLLCERRMRILFPPHQRSPS
jgi:hypothetical protein